MYVIYDKVNGLALFANYHIGLNYTSHFVHSPLNSYFIYIGYWTLNIDYYYYIFVLVCVSTINIYCVSRFFSSASII